MRAAKYEATPIKNLLNRFYDRTLISVRLAINQSDPICTKRSLFISTVMERGSNKIHFELCMDLIVPEPRRERQIE